MGQARLTIPVEYMRIRVVSKTTTVPASARGRQYWLSVLISLQPKQSSALRRRETQVRLWSTMRQPNEVRAHATRRSRMYIGFMYTTSTGKI